MKDPGFNIERYKIEAEEKWRESMEVIPHINFPSEWAIQIIPPFAGAIVRFRVKIPNVPGDVSIYLDFYDRLGSMGYPYWEVYPYQGDIGRCQMADVDELLRMIADRDDPCDP